MSGFYSDAFEFDDSGKLTNLKDVVARGKAETPEFFGVASRTTSSIDAIAGTGGVQPSTRDMNAAIRRAARR